MKSLPSQVVGSSRRSRSLVATCASVSHSTCPVPASIASSRSAVTNRAAPAHSSPIGVLSSANGELADTENRRPHWRRTGSLSGSSPSNHGATTVCPYRSPVTGIDTDKGVAPAREYARS